MPLIDAWLNPSVQDVGRFQHLLVPELTVPQRVTRIGKPSKWDSQGTPFTLYPKDQSAD